MKIFFTLLCIILLGCNDSNSVSDYQVSQSESPIQKTTGVKHDIGDGIILYALSRSPNQQESYNIKIILNPGKTGGDPTALLGKTFIEFMDLPNVGDVAAIKLSMKIKAIDECNIEQSMCREIPFDNTNGVLSFSIKQNYFYAIEK